MKIIMTPEEGKKFSEKCKESTCKTCVLCDFCCKELFIKDKTGEIQRNIDNIVFKPILITKGDGKVDET